MYAGEGRMKCAISLDSNVEVEKLVSAVNRVIQSHIKEEGSLKDSLLVISVSKVTDSQITLLLQP